MPDVKCRYRILRRRVSQLLSIEVDFTIPGFVFDGVTKACPEGCELSTFCLRTCDSDTEMVFVCVLDAQDYARSTSEKMVYGVCVVFK